MAGAALGVSGLKLAGEYKEDGRPRNFLPPVPALKLYISETPQKPGPAAQHKEPPWKWGWGEVFLRSRKRQNLITIAGFLLAWRLSRRACPSAQNKQAQPIQRALLVILFFSARPEEAAGLPAGRRPCAADNVAKAAGFLAGPWF